MRVTHQLDFDSLNEKKLSSLLILLFLLRHRESFVLKKKRDFSFGILKIVENVERCDLKLASGSMCVCVWDRLASFRMSLA